MIIFIIAWLIISYIIIFRASDEIIRDDLSLAQCFGIYIIYIIAGPIFLLNNIFIILLSLIDTEGGYDDY